MQDNISVIGIGKLGLCFSLTLENAGYNVLGIDVCQTYVDEVNNKTLLSCEPDVEKRLKRSTNFTASTQLCDGLSHSDILFVIVATPSYESGRYDHTQVETLCDELLSLPKPKVKKHLVICCTAMIVTGKQ